MATTTYHYKATFKDGSYAERKSPRLYTHAIKPDTERMTGYQPGGKLIASWAGSLDLAIKASKGGEIAHAVLVKTTGKAEPESDA